MGSNILQLDLLFCLTLIVIHTRPKYCNDELTILQIGSSVYLFVCRCITLYCDHCIITRKMKRIHPNDLRQKALSVCLHVCVSHFIVIAFLGQSQ